MPFLVQHEIDSLANVFRNRYARLGIQKLELLVLLGGDVDGRGDFLPRHGGMTMHDHRLMVKQTASSEAGSYSCSYLNSRGFRPTVANHGEFQDVCAVAGLRAPRG